ncbi:MAG TPA: recombinase family protein [Anaerolineales bacterium]|nr:recombinase family protein [Anaerolineales bacterium]
MSESLERNSLSDGTPKAGHAKVTVTHLKRDAFLYVRQSTLHQVLQNTESTQRQYALQQRAVALGWPMERVQVIDCDLGHSGASMVDREGFQRLVGEVSLAHAGIVLGLEVSRLARNSADWQRLVELCALTDTLILDEDGLYDCNDFNDRLLLGLKGTLSEAELHFLRARLRGGLLNKARRGELVCPLPVGLTYDECEHVRLDPDQQVQQAVRLLFETFRRTGAAHATVTHFQREGLLFPRRLHTGPQKGELIWGELCLSRVLQILHNPRYAGAFSFGRTRTRTWPDGEKRTQLLQFEDWLILIPKMHVGYISWEEYQENRRRLRESAQAYGVDRRKSPPREGPALLQGLLICGVCGLRMSLRYRVRRGGVFPDYICERAHINQAGPLCQHMPGQEIDAAVSRLLLETMTPISLEVALAVQQEIQTRQEEAEALRSQQVTRAQYEADLAAQRYRRVDPNNRLVACTLEAEWNAALRSLQDTQQKNERLRQKDCLLIDDQVRAQVTALSTDFPKVWNDPHTTDRDRKRMLRLLIEDVTVTKTHEITLQVRFRGGTTQTLTLPAARPIWQTWVTPPEVIQMIDDLLNEHTEGQVATILNERGLHAGKGGSFHGYTIGVLRRIYKLKSRYERLCEAGLLTVEEMAKALDVSPTTVKVWRNAGLLHGFASNDKGVYLFEPPGLDAPTKIPGRKLAKRRRFPASKIIPEPTKEVQYES